MLKIVYNFSVPAQSIAYTPSINEDELQCDHCGEIKDKDEFGGTRDNKPICKACVTHIRGIRAFLSSSRKTARRQRAERKFGLKPGAYEEILSAQNGVCAICSSPPTSNKLIKIPFLCVDHCHETTLVRGLLCSGCNSGLGHFKDDISRLEKAVEYLKKHRLAAYGKV